jgi:hypothetical protein
MKLDYHQPEQFAAKAELQKKQEKEITLIDVTRKNKSHRLYEYDKATGEVNEAEYIQNDTYTIGSEGQNKVHVRPNCIYVQAMNKANALKHAKRILGAEK